MKTHTTNCTLKYLASSYRSTSASYSAFKDAHVLLQQSSRSRLPLDNDAPHSMGADVRHCGVVRLIGDAEADANIQRFYAARHSFLSSQRFSEASVGSSWGDFISNTDWYLLAWSALHLSQAR